MAATIHEQIEEFCGHNGCDLSAEYLPELGTWFVSLNFHDAIPQFVSRRGDTFGQAVGAALAQAKAEAEERRRARRVPK